MKRTKNNNPQTMASDMVSRSMMARGILGKQYGADRDVYQVLGYDTELRFEHFYAQYKRQDIASAIINRPVSATWRGALKLQEASDEKKKPSADPNETTPFEKQWAELEKKLKLKSNLVRLDKLSRIGQYGILFLGFSDAKTREQLREPVQGGSLKLLYVKPISEGNAVISRWVEDPTDERYGMPLYYTITIHSPASQKSHTMVIHYSRVLHVADGLLEGNVVGQSKLEPVFNRLKDLEKLVGGSAEMFWRGARPGYTGSINPEYGMGEEERQKLREQIDEYDHNLRRFLVTSGVQMSSLESQVADPMHHVDVQIQMISAETGIPKRILTGSERGELSSTEDRDNWLETIESRRKEFVEPYILHPLVDILIEYGVLPNPPQGYAVDWEDLWSVSEKERAEVGKIRTQSLQAYAQNPFALDILPPVLFYKYCLGLNDDEIQAITKAQEQSMLEEDEDEVADEVEDEEVGNGTGG